MVFWKIQSIMSDVSHTCKNCTHWQDSPTQTIPSGSEKICGLSRNMSFGAYGQDGKAIITSSFFGCLSWKERPSNTDCKMISAEEGLQACKDVIQGLPVLEPIKR